MSLQCAVACDGLSRRPQGTPNYSVRCSTRCPEKGDADTDIRTRMNIYGNVVDDQIEQALQRFPVSLR